MNNPCPILTHGRQHDKQRKPKHLNRIVEGGLSNINKYGFYDSTSPEVITLIKEEIKGL